MALAYTLWLSAATCASAVFSASPGALVVEQVFFRAVTDKLQSANETANETTTGRRLLAAFDLTTQFGLIFAYAHIKPLFSGSGHTAALVATPSVVIPNIGTAPRSYIVGTNIPFSEWGSRVACVTNLPMRVGPQSVAERECFADDRFNLRAIAMSSSSPSILFSTVLSCLNFGDERPTPGDSSRLYAFPDGGSGAADLRPILDKFSFSDPAGPVARTLFAWHKAICPDACYVMDGFDPRLLPQNGRPPTWCQLLQDEGAQKIQIAYLKSNPQDASDALAIEERVAALRAQNTQDAESLAAFSESQEKINRMNLRLLLDLDVTARSTRDLVLRLQANDLLQGRLGDLISLRDYNYAVGQRLRALEAVDVAESASVAAMASLPPGVALPPSALAARVAFVGVGSGGVYGCLYGDDGGEGRLAAAHLPAPRVLDVVTAQGYIPQHTQVLHYGEPLSSLADAVEVVLSGLRCQELRFAEGELDSGRLNVVALSNSDLVEVYLNRPELFSCAAWTASADTVYDDVFVLDARGDFLSNPSPSTEPRLENPVADRRVRVGVTDAMRRSCEYITGAALIPVELAEGSWMCAWGDPLTRADINTAVPPLEDYAPYSEEGQGLPLEITWVGNGGGGLVLAGSRRPIGNQNTQCTDYQRFVLEVPPPDKAFSCLLAQTCALSDQGHVACRSATLSPASFPYPSVTGPIVCTPNPAFPGLACTPLATPLPGWAGNFTDVQETGIENLVPLEYTSRLFALNAAGGVEQWLLHYAQLDVLLPVVVSSVVSVLEEIEVSCLDLIDNFATVVALASPANFLATAPIGSFDVHIGNTGSVVFFRWSSNTITEDPAVALAACLEEEDIIRGTTFPVFSQAARDNFNRLVLQATVVYSTTADGLTARIPFPGESLVSRARVLVAAEAYTTNPAAFIPTFEKFGVAGIDRFPRACGLTYAGELWCQGDVFAPGLVSPGYGRLPFLTTTKTYVEISTGGHLRVDICAILTGRENIDCYTCTSGPCFIHPVPIPMAPVGYAYHDLQAVRSQAICATLTPVNATVGELVCVSVPPATGEPRFVPVDTPFAPVFLYSTALLYPSESLFDDLLLDLFPPLSNASAVPTEDATPAWEAELRASFSDASNPYVSAPIAPDRGIVSGDVFERCVSDTRACTLGQSDAVFALGAATISELSDTTRRCEDPALPGQGSARFQVVGAAGASSVIGLCRSPVEFPVEDVAANARVCPTVYLGSYGTAPYTYEHIQDAADDDNDGVLQPPVARPPVPIIRGAFGPWDSGLTTAGASLDVEARWNLVRAVASVPGRTLTWTAAGTGESVTVRLPIAAGAPAVVQYDNAEFSLNGCWAFELSRVYFASGPPSPELVTLRADLDVDPAAPNVTVSISHTVMCACGGLLEHVVDRYLRDTRVAGAALAGCADTTVTLTRGSEGADVTGQEAGGQWRRGRRTDYVLHRLRGATGERFTASGWADATRRLVQGVGAALVPAEFRYAHSLLGLVTTGKVYTEPFVLVFNQTGATEQTRPAAYALTGANATAAPRWWLDEGRLPTFAVEILSSWVDSHGGLLYDLSPVFDGLPNCTALNQTEPGVCPVRDLRFARVWYVVAARSCREVEVLFSAALAQPGPPDLGALFLPSLNTTESLNATEGADAVVCGWSAVTAERFGSELPASAIPDVVASFQGFQAIATALAAQDALVAAANAELATLGAEVEADLAAHLGETANYTAAAARVSAIWSRLNGTSLDLVDYMSGIMVEQAAVASTDREPAAGSQLPGCEGGLLGTETRCRSSAAFDAVAVLAIMYIGVEFVMVTCGLIHPGPLLLIIQMVATGVVVTHFTLTISAMLVDALVISALVYMIVVLAVVVSLVRSSEACVKTTGKQSKE